MIPRILHQLKFSPVDQQALTWEERQLSRKAQALMPEWKYHLWRDAAGLSLMGKIFPQHVDEYLKLPAPVIRVDVARCLFLYEYGGVYFDTDYRFFQPLNEKLLSHQCILGVEEQVNAGVGGGPKLGNAFIASEAGLSLWPDFVESIFTRFRNGETRIMNLGGPHALTRFLKQHKDHETRMTMLPPNVLYPAFTKFKLTARRDGETVGVHLCWGSWRNKPLPQQLKNRARRILSAF
jgi:mannosyltransferase OCH1-like enzyme